MGVAVGCIRLSYDDFSRLYPDEFESICKAYSDSREADQHGAWERMRMLATITIQPHIKSKMTPQKLMPLPWDKHHIERPDAPKLTPEERQERFKKLAAKLGDKTI